MRASARGLCAALEELDCARGARCARALEELDWRCARVPLADADPRPCTRLQPRNPVPDTATSVQFVPGMRFLVFDFGVDCDVSGAAGGIMMVSRA
eukprot:2529459-Rhodomonas_salina.1